MRLAVPGGADDAALTAAAETRPAASAFERAYDESWPPVFRFALAWTNDWQAAEDITQEAFVRLWANRSGVDWATPTLPWLLTAARRMATDRFRRLRRLLDGGPRIREPALDADDRARWLDVRAAFGRLTPAERVALTLTTVMGLDAEEAAAITATTASSVRSAVFRARRKLERA